MVRNQKIKKGKTTKIITPQLVPKNVYTSYQRLIVAMQKDISSAVLIESGYRSPAYQIIVFLFYLKHHTWNMRKTAKRVALPGYSEHGFPKKQALDFITINGIPSDANPLAFAKTPEYAWLCKHAQRFGFSLSYPKNNTWGVTFEPWHWSFKNWS